MQKKSKLSAKDRRLVVVSIVSGLGIMVILLAVFAFLPLLQTVEPESSTEPVSSVSQPQEVVSSEPEPEPEIIPTRDDIDFAELTELNADTLGYLNVPNTVIDYPVVRGVDNMKYLTTDFTGGFSVLGTVFADMFNGDNLTEPVTVLYGHYEPNETFFTQLHNYRDAEYFEENPDIFLYTPESDYKYKIVSAFINNDLSMLYEKDYTDEEQMQGFIDYISTPPDDEANLDTEGLTTDDTFLVLSTCMDAYGSAGKRYVVVAQMIDTLPHESSDSADISE